MHTVYLLGIGSLRVRTREVRVARWRLGYAIPVQGPRILQGLRRRLRMRYSFHCGRGRPLTNTEREEERGNARRSRDGPDEDSSGRRSCGLPFLSLNVNTSRPSHWMSNDERFVRRAECGARSTVCAGQCRNDNHKQYHSPTAVLLSGKKLRH